MGDNNSYIIEFRSLYNAQRIDKDNNIQPVDGIAGKRFVIKPYQRGYRWQKNDIVKLINDIYKYASTTNKSADDHIYFAKGDYDDLKDKGKFDFYCLQTLTVKKIGDNNEDTDSRIDSYELIDGQQRLTTTLILFEILNLMVEGIGSDRLDTPYQFIYDRGSNTTFDMGLIIRDILAEEQEFDGKNVTLKIQFRSYSTTNDVEKKSNILSWLDQYKNNIDEAITSGNYSGSLKIDLHYISEAIKATLDYFFDNIRSTDMLRLLLQYILYNVFFIWYELIEDPYEAFVSLNTNQIKLTNAELIKSLVLREDNNLKDEVKINSKRWEDLEQGLSRSELWAFISGEDKATKLDLILELFAKKTSDYKYESNNDEWSLFSWYEEYYNRMPANDSNSFAKIVLEGVEEFYDRICEWYEDVDVYHYVGLLTEYRVLGLIDKTQEELITDVFKLYQECEDRKTFIDSLKKEVKEAIKKDLKDDIEYDTAIEVFEALSYDSEDTNQKQRRNVHAVLWLLNAWEIMESNQNNDTKNDEKTRTNHINNRLPFSRVIDGGWTLEHIMPQNPEETPIRVDDTKKDGYISLISEIKNDSVNDSELLDESEKQLIWNLALLMKEDNSSISNDNLERKRKNLIGRIGRGSFVPIATVNAFLLYYNEEESRSIDIKYWTKRNAESYKKRVLQCLESVGFGGKND